MRNNQRRLNRVNESGSPSPASVSPELAYAVPTEFVELPSRGEFYPEDHPLYKQETVEIKFMTAKDEDILSSTALLKKGLAVDRLLESLLILDIDPKTLFLGDRGAILLAARISGYGSEYSFSHKCEKCFNISEIEFNLSHGALSGDCFNDKFLHTEKIIYNSDTLTLDVTLPASGVTVGLSLVDGLKEKQLFAGNKANETSPITSILSAFVTKVNDNTDYPYIMQFIEAMPAKDSKYLRDLYPKLVPNIRLSHDFVCAECYFLKELEVPLNADFFWP
jgi:hypothetical protein